MAKFTCRVTNGIAQQPSLDGKPLENVLAIDIHVDGNPANGHRVTLELWAQDIDVDLDDCDVVRR